MLFTKNSTVCLIFFLFVNFISAQNGIGDNFDDNVLAAGWTPTADYALTEAGQQLEIDANGIINFSNFEFSFNAIDISANPILTIEVQSATAFDLRIDLKDAAGNFTNATPTVQTITTGPMTLYTFDFTGRFNQTFPGPAAVDPTQITSASFFFNPGGSFTGTANFENLQIGTAGPQDGGGGGSPVSFNGNIRINQHGYHPEYAKLAAVVNSGPADFHVCNFDLSDTVFSGALSAASVWPYSNESVRTADFSNLELNGNYVLVVEGMGRTNEFSVDTGVYLNLAKASLKAYYYQRASIDILPAYGGLWSRPGAHYETNIQVHNSAATAARPTGTVISSPRGWYDAGDFGKYIVNSGISTYTLLLLYEQYPVLYDTMDVNIPESGDAVPDLLDEIRWNVQWMLSMQNPSDGSVYHKLTETGFPGRIMPDASTAARYVIGRSTEAALDFAAVMAQAYRVYRPYDAFFPGFSDSCLTAARAAYDWAKANPAQQFTANPPGITTGEYRNSDISQCFQWAGAELYISTLEDSFYLDNSPTTGTFTLPRWDTVATLGIISLVHHKNNLTAIADTAAAKSILLSLADDYENEYQNSAYRTSMGNLAYDFSWGSNSFIANQAIVLLQAYRLTDQERYLDAAIGAMDYILGKNATNYSFVSGFGWNYPMFLHHRQMDADGIAEPIPGFMAGGPQMDNNPDGCGYPVPNFPGTQYSDTWCSYSTNEVTINWNAPLAFLSGALIMESENNEEPLFINFNDDKEIDKQKSIDKTFRIYPNPASDFVRIIAETAGIIKIYDANLKLSHEEIVSENSMNEIGIENLKRGFYFIQFIPESGETISRKLIVK